MLQTFEGYIDENGNLRISEKVDLPKSRRVIITVLKDDQLEEIQNTALLSEPALARDWDRPEEDQAWTHLDQLPSL